MLGVLLREALIGQSGRWSRNKGREGGWYEVRDLVPIHWDGNLYTTVSIFLRPGRVVLVPKSA